MASRTVACSVLNEAPSATDWPDPDVAEMVAGAWLTVTVSLLDRTAVPGAAWTGSPPPYAAPVLVTDVGEAAGTFTVRANVGNDAPPLIALVEVQVTLFDPLQLHPVPLKLDSV